LREAISRVQAIAAVHDLLSDESRLAGTTVDVIARHAADEAYGTLIPPGLTVDFVIPPSNVGVPSKQATILALLINELVANAVRHGFAGRDHGTVTIRAREELGGSSSRSAMMARQSSMTSTPM
jgi:two-component sensor histidine kinase